MKTSIRPVCVEALRFSLNRNIIFKKYNEKKKQAEPVDCPMAIARTVHAIAPQYLPELKTVRSAPLYDPGTDRLIEKHGYDKATQIYLALEGMIGWPGVPSDPTDDQAKAALEELWRPFARFPFVSAVDRGVFLAAILTAAVRSLLPTAPGFAAAAPTAGSGKTLLALCLATLAGDDRPAPMPVSCDREELKKTLLSAARADRSEVDPMSRPILTFFKLHFFD